MSTESFSLYLRRFSLGELKKQACGEKLVFFRLIRAYRSPYTDYYRSLFLYIDCTKESTVVFLLDSSRNVGEDNIKRQVEFIITVASTLDFNSIGVIAYASDAHYLYKPGQESSFSEFAHTLRMANYSMGKYKNLGKALIKSSEEVRFDYSKVGIVVAMIAGKAEDEYAVPAALLQKNHVTVIGLVLGSNYSISQINHLVTNPNEEHVLRSEFADLKHFAGATRNAICKGWLRENFLE